MMYNIRTDPRERERERERGGMVFRDWVDRLQDKDRWTWS
jgi:hypothetical protein